MTPAEYAKTPKSSTTCWRTRSRLVSTTTGSGSASSTRRKPHQSLSTRIGGSRSSGMRLAWPVRG